MNASTEPSDLSVKLGRLTLPNPIMVASGTFGYAREMEALVDLSRLGGIIPKTVTPLPRLGNVPWRTVETASGLLNSIGLDNDGIDHFIEHHMSYLRDCGCPIVASIAGATEDDYVRSTEKLESTGGVAAVELNISCPNVTGGVDFGTVPDLCGGVVQAVVQASNLPVLAKLTPNVTDLPRIARAAADGGADAITLINTLPGMSVDWRNRRPMLGNVIGGLSGPAIKPVALRCVHQVYRAVEIPIVGVGGIATVDDCLEFFVTGATAIQIGTANFYNPTCSTQILTALPGALAELGTNRLSEIVGSLDVGKSGEAETSPPMGL